MNEVHKNIAKCKIGSEKRGEKEKPLTPGGVNGSYL
jgi:hypothetical protein